jgi:hypothetical protein
MQRFRNAQRRRHDELDRKSWLSGAFAGVLRFVLRGVAARAQAMAGNPPQQEHATQRSST